MKAPKKIYATNKSDVYHFDDIWSLDLLDINDYSPENYRDHRGVFVVIDTFCKIVWTVPLKNRNSQTVKDSFKNNHINSKRLPFLIETDRGKEFCNKTFQNFLNENSIKFMSRNTTPGAALQNALIELYEIFLRDQFLNKVTVFGLMY